ncbi:MAG: divalent-cation tolerance protein CutA [Bryobacteraceae bacterium]
MKIILSTCETREDALRIADHLVAGRFAACVNILPGVTSVYPWKDKIEEASEVLLLIKTAAEKVDETREELKRVHPYDIPEVVTVDVEHASQAYRDWLEKWIWQK